jgi:hypothetical protein
MTVAQLARTSGQLAKELYSKKGLSGPGKYSGNSMSFAPAVLQSPILFNFYLDDTVRRWKSQLITQNFPGQFGEITFITLMFADDQMMLKTPCRGPHELYKITNN